MAERSVGIRELKARLSECVREVKRGATIVVTEHGRPVARMVPDAPSFAEQLSIMADAGVVAWSGRRLPRKLPRPRVRRRASVADLVVENRK